MSLIRVNDVIASQNENFRFVKVRFKHEGGGFSSKEYTYKTLDATLEAGDEVIVKSPTKGMVIVSVTEVLSYYEVSEEFNFSIKWVVQKVDTTEYLARIEKERGVAKKLSEIIANEMQLF